MLLRLLKDTEMGGCWFRSGTILALGQKDKPEPDGTIKYFFSPGHFHALRKDEYKLIYSSAEEMERAQEEAKRERTDGDTKSGNKSKP
jgi:hypothetical protein